MDLAQFIQALSAAQAPRQAPPPTRGGGGGGGRVPQGGMTPQLLQALLMASRAPRQAMGGLQQLSSRRPANDPTRYLQSLFPALIRAEAARKYGWRDETPRDVLGEYLRDPRSVRWDQFQMPAQREGGAAFEQRQRSQANQKDRR